MSLTVIIGHRGTGKSAFLRRVQGYFEGQGEDQPRFLDLDQEIVQREGRSIVRIFEQVGEAGFRRIETKVFEAIAAEADRGQPIFLSLGGGFQGRIPLEARRVWLRRPTDPNGRVFLDRPRLNSEVSAFDEYLLAFGPREERYRELATETWIQTEGFDFTNRMEEYFAWNALVPDAGASRELELGGGVVSLLPAHFREEGGGFENWIWRRLRWKGCRFELRDDLLEERQLELAWRMIPSHRLLFSFRKGVPSREALEAVGGRGCAWDWPLELGGFPLEGLPTACRPSILSLHERAPGESVLKAAARLESEAARSSVQGQAVLKLAVEARDFDELLEGHAWAEADRARRAFLPRTPTGETGRWAWYRMQTLERMPLSFVREGAGTSLDQPSLMDWLRVRLCRQQAQANPPGAFAAVLGDPVAHSRTPAEHYRFFMERGMPVLAVPVSEAEWEAGALGKLARLGLRYAAVTSPLKKLAHAACLPGEGALNTLYLDDAGKWHGRNTDSDGLRALLAPFAAQEPVVWGGGGTVESIAEVAPSAVLYSARTGQPRASGKAVVSPRAVIWALGRGRMGEGTLWPPREWKPERVIDLNYAEDSPGREYALRTGAAYVSGLGMFQEQARRQRSWWQGCR